MIAAFTLLKFFETIIVLLCVSFFVLVAARYAP